MLLVLFSFINHFSLLINPIFAAESSPSADIKSQLEELKKQIASKAAKLKQEINRKLTDKVYAGVIQSKTDNSLDLSNDQRLKTVSINIDTIFESNIKGKQKFSQKTIASGDFVAGLGDVDETGVLLARKVVLLPQNSEKPKISLWGQVISVSDGLITVRDKNKENVAISLPKSAKVNIGDVVILTGIKDKDDIFDAGFVYVVPGIKAKVKKIIYPAKGEATPSTSSKTTLKASSSAKPAVKKSN